jgi:hypothetical protein
MEPFRRLAARGDTVRCVAAAFSFGLAATCAAQGDPNLQFLINTTNRYALSTNSVDVGQPVIFLYRNYFNPTYFDSIETGGTGLSLDGNDPDAAVGTSSWRMTWTGAGPGAFFGFRFFGGHANGPRDLPAFGMARRLRFLAKPEATGLQIQASVLKAVAGGSVEQIASQWFPLAAGWNDYVLEVPPLLPKDLYSIQFKMDTDHGSGTLRLDEVRVGTDGFDPLRVPQSYVALWSAGGSSGPEYRDANIYPNRSFLYDAALTILALVSSGDPDARAMARDIANGLLVTALPDGTFLNERNAGHTLLGDGAPRPAYSQKQTLGDDAWLGLALLEMHGVTGQAGYLAAARAISDWAEANLKASGPLNGYRGGYDGSGAAYPWRSTEHNCDAFQLHRHLAQALAEAGDPAAQVYAARAGHAASFVLAMFDSAGGAFYTGTGSGDDINSSSLPLDTQMWPLLTLGQWPEYEGAIDWRRPVQWATDHLRRTDGAFTGFTYSNASSPDRVWFEGNAFAVPVYRILHEPDLEQAAVSVLELARLQGLHADPQGRGQIAASGDGLQDLQLGAVYDARLALAPTAWTYLGKRGFNPFDLVGGRQQTAVDFGGDGTADVVVFRGGAWLSFDFANGSPDGSGWTGSAPGCIPVPADYDGDGRVELAQFCAGSWRFYAPDGSFLREIATGSSTDIPVPADYDGDGKDDVMVFRAGAWIAFDRLTGVQTTAVWTGMPPHLTGGTPVPVPIDVDGHGARFSIYCGGPWHFYNRDGSYQKGIWTGSIPNDLPAAGDYDGDGREEVVVWRAGAWLFFSFATGGFERGIWTGAPAHATGGRSLPAPLDLDGDGRLDLTVYSGGPWHFYNRDGSYQKGIWTGAVPGDMGLSRRLLP